MIALALTFLRSPLGKFAAIALAVALALWGVHHVGYSAGVKANEARHVKALEKAQKRVLEAEKQAAAISARVGEKHTVTVEKIRTVTQTLTKEVPYAVPSDPARASLGVGFVRLHDAAATGLPSLSDPAGRPDAEASGITDADLARTVIANYETCRVNAETVMAWQSWQADQAALYNATSRAKP